MKSLQDYWYITNPFVWLLLPLSWLYCVVVSVRRKLYQLNILKSYDHEIPVVVIGNIVVGGSGKTPLLIALCEYLQARNIRVGVVSRGYGGLATGINQISKADDAERVGDEPLMIYRHTGVPVVIGRDRSAAIDYLLANNEIDIILSDDGLQHYRMCRQYEIAVIDSSRGFGNGFCLPAGPLRERKSRLKDVDLVVYNDTDGSVSGSCSYTLQLNKCKNITDGNVRELSEFTGKTLHAVAGIGNPGRFFDNLRDRKLTIIEHPFADHHMYRMSDFSGWNDECILMTEKDAVKCQQLPLSDAWSVGVTVTLSAELESRLSQDLASLLR